MNYDYEEFSNHLEIVKGLRNIVKEHGLSSSVKKFISSEETLSEHIDLTDTQTCLTGMEGFISFIKKFFAKKPKKISPDAYLADIEADDTDWFAFTLYSATYGVSVNGNWIQIGRQLVDKYLNRENEDLSIKFKGFTIDQVIDAFNENIKVLKVIISTADNFRSGQYDNVNLISDIKKLRLKYVTIDQGGYIDPLPYGKDKKKFIRPTTVDKSGWFDKNKLSELELILKKLHELEENISVNYWDEWLGDFYPDDDNFPSDKLDTLRAATEAYYEFCMQGYDYSWIEYIAVSDLIVAFNLTLYPHKTKFEDGLPVE